MQSFQLGAVEVVRVVEWQGEIAPARDIVPSPPELWRDHESLLVPDHWHPERDRYHAAVQTWVLRSEGKVILVDTGVGNGRDRPQIPLFDHLDTGFAERLAAAGVRAEEVNLVVNTHIHYDHVGWNTRWDGGWVPTFPNATYLIPKLDQVYFDPRNEHRRPVPRTASDQVRRKGSHLVYEDSIAPVLDRATLWENSHRIDRNLTLEPAPGHTPGSSILRLKSNGDRAVFVGDILHSPVQILAPEHNSCFCENPAQAIATRNQTLEHAADERELVIPAHFAGTGATEITRNGTGFAVQPWTP
ncbi:MBL fold metallo-hydrolase [Amycolatopsis ultiminotia]|uniref:MBL fold metallo-hydrolase n=1 Tax=Amycolatopsis ultiminotia TaxID=543629 RepID=A0ABP6XS06_9PSEU